LWLGDSDSRDSSRVGAKAANLSAHYERHVVPPGFVVPAVPAAWTTLPDQLRSDIAEAYQRLADLCGTDQPYVAVRSSALDEDGAATSFAGQHDTYLNLRGSDAVMDAVIRCLNSALSVEALAYRKQAGLPDDDIRIAVLIQQLVPAESSAVVFSCNPVSGSQDEVMINSNWGLGESIVGGTATPDAFTVDKETGEILDRMISRKLLMTVRDHSGTHDVAVPPELQSRPSVTDAQIVSLAQLALALEGSMQHPVDIECAMAGGQVHLLQCRPITTLG